MNFINCKKCNSGMVNILSINNKLSSNEPSNIKLHNKYLCIQNPDGVQINYFCYSCRNKFDIILKNMNRCATIEYDFKLNETNEIIDGGRFN